MSTHLNFRLSGSSYKVKPWHSRATPRVCRVQCGLVAMVYKAVINHILTPLAMARASPIPRAVSHIGPLPVAVSLLPCPL